MKIVLIASFSSADIREHLEFRNDSKFFRFVLKMFRLPNRVLNFWDSAPWINGITSYFEKIDNIELHVVGPHIRLKRPIEEFTLRGVTYHFYRTEFTSFLRVLNRYPIWKRLQRSGYYVRKIVNEQRPDLIVLSGSEDAASSVSVLNLKEYPRICLCQTVYNNPERAKYGNPNRLIQDMEKDIFSQLRYFGVYSSMHYRLLKEFRPDAFIFKFGYPSKGGIYEPSSVEKVYDFVNFAQMHGSRKGTTDSILALAIVKKKYPNVTLNIVGGCDPTGLETLKQLCEKMGVTDNVVFTPFFEKKEDLLLHVQKARFAVLPCKLDHTSGTMHQSMQLGLPLVVYKTTGTPAFNREKQCALIAEKENVEQLAQHMLSLMENPELAEMLSKNAREYQEKKSEEKLKNGDRLYATFKAVFENYKKGIEIPQELLFNPENDD